MPALLIASDTLAETALACAAAVPRRPGRPWGRRVTAGLAALSLLAGLAVTGAAPARADSRDTLKALAAIAAIAALSREINRKSDREARAPRPPRTPAPVPVVTPRLPAACAIDIDSTTSGAPVRVFAEHCLRDAGVTWALPESCARPVRLFGRPDRVFSAPCLQSRGFETGVR